MPKKEERDRTPRGRGGGGERVGGGGRKGKGWGKEGGKNT